MALNNRLFVIRQMLQNTRQFYTSKLRTGYEGPGKTTVDILTESNKGLLINKCLPVGFKLSNNSIAVGSLALFSNTILSWNVKYGSDINEENLSLFTVLHPRLDILVIGLETHYSYKHIFEIRKILMKHNIRSEVLHVKQACGIYNFLINDGMHTAAALIPPLLEKSETYLGLINDKLLVEPK